MRRPRRATRAGLPSAGGYDGRHDPQALRELRSYASRKGCHAVADNHSRGGWKGQGPNSPDGSWHALPARGSRQAFARRRTSVLRAAFQMRRYGPVRDRLRRHSPSNSSTEIPSLSPCARRRAYMRMYRRMCRTSEWLILLVECMRSGIHSALIPANMETGDVALRCR